MSEDTLYECSVCKLHYRDWEISKQCEAFCREFHGCSLEITRQSVEHEEFIAHQKDQSS